VGVGDPLEAPYRLNAPIPAGPWQFVGDGLAEMSCDVKFEVLWRSAAGDQSITTFMQHFDAPADGFTPTPYTATMDGVAAPAAVGDHLVLRFSITSVHPPGTSQFIPNGGADGGDTRIPSLVLPQP
jgi:hypothetical protein